MGSYKYSFSVNRVEPFLNPESGGDKKRSGGHTGKIWLFNIFNIRPHLGVFRYTFTFFYLTVGFIIMFMMKLFKIFTLFMYCPILNFVPISCSISALSRRYIAHFIKPYRDPIYETNCRFAGSGMLVWFRLQYKYAYVLTLRSGCDQAHLWWAQRDTILVIIVIKLIQTQQLQMKRHFF